MLRFYNSLSLKKEPFKPLSGNEVRMYSCGPTVYNYAHIGNFRAYVFSDLLRRYLEFKGFKVKLVMNITNVDDKTIKGSRESGKPLSEFTNFFEKAFFDDLKALEIKPAFAYPRATENIPQMIVLIEKLLKKGVAYAGQDGSVYYSIKKFVDYGKLSHLKGLQTGASGRVAADDYEKENASDFALWKAHSQEDGDVFWNASFGKGRPGWHIECSSMSASLLGEPFDIHTGGVDLRFPHHENEIAQ
ncbi:MAG: cysteine--tRNA ligase, partial [Candidatus Micrarchaeota archaeon]